MGGFNLSTIFGSIAIIITSIVLFIQKLGLDKIKNLFKKNTVVVNPIEDKTDDMKRAEELSIKIKEEEKLIEKKKEKIKELIIKTKKEIEETGNITDPKRLLEEFNKW